jgi:hypothetical protein
VAKRKPGWSVNQHRDVGQRLQVLRRELMDVAMLLNDYPINSPAQKAAQKAYKALGLLRSHLDSVLAREHPAEFAADVYYGSTDPKKEIAEGK